MIWHLCLSLAGRSNNFKFVPGDHPLLANSQTRRRARCSVQFVTLAPPTFAVPVPTHLIQGGSRVCTEAFVSRSKEYVLPKSVRYFMFRLVFDVGGTYWTGQVGLFTVNQERKE